MLCLELVSKTALARRGGGGSAALMSDLMVQRI
jgi:hypothetical protein